MVEVHSPYYPPRANFWRRCFVHPLHALRRDLRLDRLSEAIGMPLWQLVSSFLIPGLALRWVKARALSRVFWPAYLVCGLVALVWLGYTVGSLAFGLMLSLHASAFLLFAARLGGRGDLTSRMALAIAVLLGLSILVYRPIGVLFTRHVFVPVRTAGSVVVVNCAASKAGLERNEIILYRIPADHGGLREGNVRVQAGFGLEPVQGMPGDEIVFTPQAMLVNGVEHARSSSMPVAGGLVVPQKHWFIWPTVATQGHGMVAAESIRATLLELALVNQDDFMGKPFKRWFGRRQPVP